MTPRNKVRSKTSFEPKPYRRIRHQVMLSRGEMGVWFKTRDDHFDFPSAGGHSHNTSSTLDIRLCGRRDLDSRLCNRLLLEGAPTMADLQGTTQNPSVRTPLIKINNRLTQGLNATVLAKIEGRKPGVQCQVPHQGAAMIWDAETTGKFEAGDACCRNRPAATPGSRLAYVCAGSRVSVDV